MRNVHYYEFCGHCPCYQNDYEKQNYCIFLKKYNVCASNCDPELRDIFIELCEEFPGE